MFRRNKLNDIFDEIYIGKVSYQGLSIEMMKDYTKPEKDRKYLVIVEFNGMQIYKNNHNTLYRARQELLKHFIKLQKVLKGVEN